MISECSLSGRGQGHVNNFYIVDLENFATASRRYTGDIHSSTVVGLFTAPIRHAMSAHSELVRRRSVQRLLGVGRRVSGQPGDTVRLCGRSPLGARGPSPGRRRPTLYALRRQTRRPQGAVCAARINQSINQSINNRLINKMT